MSVKKYILPLLSFAILLCNWVDLLCRSVVKGQSVDWCFEDNFFGVS